MFQKRKARSCSYSHPLAGTTYHNDQFVSQCSSFLDSQIPLSTHASEEHKQITKTTTHRLRATRQVQSAAQHQNPSTLSRTQPLPSYLTDRAVRSQQQQPKPIHHKRKLKRKLAINPFVDSYLFPSLDIRIVHKITAISDLQKQTIPYNIQPLFKRLVLTQLAGDFTSNFVFKIQPYIRDIIQQSCEEKEEELSEGEKKLSKKEDLLELMRELESDRAYSKVKQLVKHYCVPSTAIGKKILQQLLEDIVIEIFEKKNCSKDVEYCLMTDSGHRIVHISQIYFSTRTILIAPSQTASTSFQAYQKILEEHDRQQRMTFKQSIRHNFISKIVKQQVDSSMVNYHPQPKEHQTQRREIVELAEVIVENRSKVRLSKADLKEELRNEMYQWREPSRRATAHSYRKYQARKEYKQIIDKLHKILNPGVRYTVKSKLDQKTQSQFAILHNLNDKYDSIYASSDSNSNKILLQNLLENCSLFNTKTPLQMSKIMKMLEKVYKKSHITQIQFWQFKEIYETAYGVAQPSVIMKFVLTYLNFDQWGQVSQKEMFHLLEEAVPCRGRALQLIRSTIWNWLQKCRLIENNVLRKRNIQIWYQPVKVVYLLMISVIFGSQYRTFEEMLIEMIKYQFY